MTIGTNDILNTSIEVTKEKTSKKDYTSEDFSTISGQFASIFSNQFLTSFNNQFNYNSSSKKHDFMASTATAVTENKYYSAVNSNTSSDSNRKQNIVENNRNSDYKTPENSSTTQVNKSEQQTTENSAKPENAQNTQKAENKENTQTTENTKTTETSENKNSEKTQTQKTSEEKSEVKAGTELKTGTEEQTKEVKTENISKNKILTGSVSTEEKTEAENTASIKVAVKDDQIKEVNKLTEKTQVKVPEISETIEITDVKQTKESNVKTKVKQDEKEEVKEAKKEIKAETKAEIKDEVKITNTPEATKETLERLTANVIEGMNTEENLTLENILKKDITKNKVEAKENSHSKPAVEFKNPTAFANQNMEQNLGGNPNSQNSFKHNFLKEILPFDASSVMKNTINIHTPFHNAMQNTQVNNLMQRNIAEQVMNQIKGNIDAEKSQVSMILKPENLGRVTLNIMNEKGVLSAEIKTETKEAAEALHKNLNDLKETLKQQGVVCTNLVIKVEDPQKSDNHMNFAQQENHQRNFEQNANAGNSGEGSFQNSTNKDTNTAKAEIKQNIQEEQETPAQTTAEDKGLVDYRV